MTLVVAIIVIAALDSINPTLFIAQFYLLTTPRPVNRILSYIAGVVSVNFLGGVLLMAGLGTLIARVFAGLGSQLLYSLGLLLGIALIWFGLWLKTRAPSGGESKKPRSSRLIHAFLLGAAVMLNEITTALPYFVAIERIVAAELPRLQNIAALALYNLVFSLPLLGFLLAFLGLRERFMAQIERIGHAVHLWSLRIIKYGSIALGALLMVAAVTFFGTGTHLLG
jgi:cytochrome c biogenesis protein CcdA